MTQIIAAKLSMAGLSLLTLGFLANIASAQSDDIEAASPKLTTLYSFCSQAGCTDGESPSALIQATGGDFYGTAEGGGTSSDGCCGTIFKIGTNGVLTTVYNFCLQISPENLCADGQSPVGGLIQATNGDFYGTALGGGDYNLGTIFKITPSGTLTTLYSFCSKVLCPDGSEPNGLIQAADGNLYGATTGGGNYQNGTVYKITPGGKLTTLYKFCSQIPACPDGNRPSGMPIAAPLRSSARTRHLARCQ
jgi:uncharacterized repeat protein (TIGR03803 family)